MEFLENYLKFQGFVQYENFVPTPEKWTRPRHLVDHLNSKILDALIEEMILSETVRIILIDSHI